MKILVTGGAGFIGSHLCESLLRQGHTVTCLDNLEPFYSPAVKKKHLDILSAAAGKEKRRFVWQNADIRDHVAVFKVFRSTKPDLVIHLAARPGVRPSLEDPLGYAEVNIGGTLNLLEVCHETGVKHFIFASSSSVYGNQNKVPFSEKETEIVPISPYAATKKSAETLCRFYSENHGLSIAILRFFTAYGPRQRPDLAIHKFTKNLFEGRPIPFYGDGSMRRDYTYIEDIVGGILGAVRWVTKKRRSAVCEVFNLGESRPVALRDLVRSLEKVSGKKAILKKLPVPQGDVRTTYADIRKARKVLGYCPQTDLETGLKRFVQWYGEEHES